MCMFFKKKVLPIPTGPHGTSCADLMTEYSQNGIFIRLYYPTAVLPETSKLGDHWLPWIPHDKYVKGLAYVVGVWVFLIQIVMWWFGGKMHIPIMSEAELLQQDQSSNKKLPVVIFSHGFGAARFFCSNMLNELASQGYVIASLEHRDKSACATYYYESPSHRDRDERTWLPHTKLELNSGHFKLRQKQIKYRSNECIKALDLLTEINNGNTSSNILNTNLNLQKFKGQLNLDLVTIMGHSFGGATALLSLASDSRFRQGVILDGWMYPLKDDSIIVSQPLLFINSPTFHISSNLVVMNKIIKSPETAHRQLYTIKLSTHETQTDTPFVLGYWLDRFKRKINPSLGSMLNNYLIVKFLQQYTGSPKDLSNIQEVLDSKNELIIEGTTPKPVPARRTLSFIMR